MPPALAGGFLNRPAAQEDNTSVNILSSMASGLGTAVSGRGHFGDSLVDQAAGVASGVAGEQLAGWLQQSGTARVNLNVDRRGSWDTSSVDWLVPLWQSPKNMLFTQLGFRSPDGRRTLNSGVGVRSFSNEWMLGANVFIDNDFTGHNRRVSIGAEAWRDYLKLSASTYFGMTNWHQSRDFDDYDERPADGWDIRTQAWVPVLPQLGGQLTYEKYYGNTVALVDKNTRGRNPSATTAGLNYTPIPLVSLGLDHRMVAGGYNDTQFFVKFRYQFGIPWQTQISPDAVLALRTLAGSRYDLVERNNAIVLNYRKQDLISLRLPQDLEGEGGADIRIIAQVTSKYALDSLDWRVTSVTSAGGTISAKGSRDVRLKLPAWQAQGLNQYRISAVARDTRGNRSGIASTVITVSKPSARLEDGSVTVMRNNASADGRATNVVQAKVTDVNGRPLSGQTVSFTATNGAIVTVVTGTTGTNGTARVTLTSLTSGESVVTACLANGQSSSATVTFRDVARISAGDLIVMQNNAVADGMAKNSVRARVTNASGKPISGQIVSFSATNGAVVKVVNSTTGVDGIATASLTSTTAGTSLVKASLRNGNTSEVSVTFNAFAHIAAGDMTVIKNNAPADGNAVNTVLARVTDAAGKALIGQSVRFVATNGARMKIVTGTTGTDGIASANLTSTIAGNSVVTGTLLNGTSASVTVTFTALSDIGIKDFRILRNNAPADGSDTDQVRLRVLDGTGAALPGQRVNFVATNGAKLSATTALTGTDGAVTVSLSSQNSGNSVITATLADGSSSTITVTFISAAEIESGSFVVTANNAVADGLATNAVQLKVVNGDGVAVSGQRVAFTATNGATLTRTTVMTRSDGLATTTLANTTAGSSIVTATLADGASADVRVVFIAAAQIKPGSFVVIANNAAADGAATNVVQLKVINGSGVAVSGQPVTFKATNGAIMATSTVTTGSDGLATNTLTSTKAGESIVTAKLTRTGESGTVTVKFAQSYANFAGVAVNGQRFVVTAGFPETGFDGAEFTLSLPGSSRAENYIWATSAPWAFASAEAGTPNGTVRFKGTGTGSQVNVTATPVSGTGQVYRYTINLKKWFIFGSDEQSRAVNTANCSSAGYEVPSYTDLTNAPVSRKNGTRAVGALWSEWGNLGSYPVGIRSYYTYMAAEYDNTVQYSVRLTTGWIYETASSIKNTVVCMKRG